MNHCWAAVISSSFQWLFLFSRCLTLPSLRSDPSISFHIYLFSLSVFPVLYFPPSGFSGDHLLPPFVHCCNIDTLHFSLLLWHTLWRERVCWGVSVDAAALRSKRERCRMLAYMHACTHAHTHTCSTHTKPTFLTLGQYEDNLCVSLW